MGELGPAELLIALTAVLIGACLQGSLGFGLGLVAAPVLVLLDPRLVPGPLLCLGIPLAVLIAWRERRNLEFGRVGWAIVGRVPGSVVGSLAVVVLSARWLAALFSLAVLTAVVLSVGGWSALPTARNQLLAGFGSGMMGTATSVGGPPIALLYQRDSGPELRAALAAFVLVAAFVSVGLLIAVGEFGWADARLATIFVPAVLAGFVLSRWTNRVLDNGLTRPAVLVFATVSALYILIRQVL